MASTLLLTSLCAVGLAAAYVYSQITRERRLPLPPGPRGHPLLGNVSDLPKPGEYEAQHWLKHKELYGMLRYATHWLYEEHHLLLEGPANTMVHLAYEGPLSSITVLGKTIVIINDAKIALELMDKRSAKHSSRPKQIFAGEM
jgi:hypothetical protein